MVNLVTDKMIITIRVVVKYFSIANNNLDEVIVCDVKKINGARDTIYFNVYY